MNNILFTATGCARCHIVKGYMNDHDIAFEEKDMKAEGKDDFKKFYSENRKEVFRGPDGIEFPIFTDGKNIRQGIGAITAYLNSGHKLDGFFSVGILHKEWVDGIHVSGGSPEYAEEFLNVLRFLKGKSMKLQLTTDGRNSRILEKVLEEKLADVLIMNVLGTPALYPQMLGENVDFSEVEASIALVPKFPQYQFQTTVVPILRSTGDMSYLTPAEIGEIAQLIKDITGSIKQPYLIRPSNLDGKESQGSLEPLTNNMLFSYRTAARVHQVQADIEKVS